MEHCWRRDFHAYFLCLILFCFFSSLLMMYFLDPSKVFPASETYEPACNVSFHSFITLQYNSAPDIVDVDYYMVLFSGLFPAYPETVTSESITLATHGTVDMLHNVVSLADRWQGPISLATYAPGSDFIRGIEFVVQLRVCYPIVRKFVSFHFFLDGAYFDFKSLDCAEISRNASSKPIEPWQCKLLQPPYRTFVRSHGLDYPINVARNFARNNSKTRFLLSLDIEFLPSENFIQQFLFMINKSRNNKTNAVYVLPAYEYNRGLDPPRNKSELVQLIKNRKAVIYRKNVCLVCHHYGRIFYWENFIPKNEELGLLDAVRWHMDWEPVFVSTHDVPYYDDRFFWFGRDKQTQVFLMCVQDYKFQILDNAFVVHEGLTEKNSQTPRRINQFLFKQLTESAKVKFWDNRVANCLEI